MAIIVRVYKGRGDCEASSISDALITSVTAAKARGKRWLEDPSQGAYYLVKKRTLTVTHKSASVVPGAWITVTDGKLGLVNQLMKVVSYTISISRTGVWGRMEAEQYVEFDIPNN